MPASRSKRSSGSGVSATRSVPYDLSRPENKTVSQLKDELDSKGIDYPRYARKSQLISLWKRSGNSPAQGSRQKVSVSPISDDEDTSVLPRSQLPDNPERGFRELGLRHESQNAHGSQNATPASATTTNAHVMHEVNKDGSLQTALLLSLTETVKTLSDKVNAMQTPVTNWIGRPDRRCYEDLTAKGTEYTLASAMSAMPSTSTVREVNTNSNTTSAATDITDYGPQLPQCQSPIAASHQLSASPSTSQSYGFAVDSLPFVETVSPAIRRQVIEGKDVNLAVLLIPYYTGPMSNDEKIDTYYCSNRKPDPRLNKCLNISEFIQAFGTYKNIMCEAFPNRRHELDLYEREIVNMASRYPGAGFYDYHKQFSAKAASYLKNHNWKVDWSKRDSQLYSNIFTNYKSNCCQHCYSVSHLSDFCPRILQENKSAFYGPASNNYPNKRSGSSDSYGRQKHYMKGEEICNNFNGNKGCFRSRCNNLHVCIGCHGLHPRSQCTKDKDSTSKTLSQPKNDQAPRNSQNQRK